MGGKGALAIWNDHDPARAALYEEWYQTEHMIERLEVPGFLRGRRYQVISGSTHFFTWYEVETPEVLRSEFYQNQLASPTPMTQAVMDGVFLDSSRTVCNREILAGEIFGAVVVTARFAEAPARAQVDAAMKGIINPVSLARAELWTSDEDPNRVIGAEEQIRGPDKKIDGCVMLEFLREEPAAVAAATLAAAFKDAEIGTYRLMCERMSA
jgi:hypothetical protein